MAIVKLFSFSLRQYILCWAHACKLRWERDRHGEKLEFFSFSFCNAMHDRLGCCVLRVAGKDDEIGRGMEKFDYSASASVRMHGC